MKWVKFKDEMDPNISPGDKKRFFDIIPTGKKGSKILPKGFEEWVTYPEPGGPPLPKLGKRAKRKYEIFCGGFLYYHDVEFKKYPQGKGYTDEKGYPECKTYPTTVKGPDGKKYPGKDFEHKIFFEWLPKGKGVEEDKVRIYINTTPTGFNTNPPKPPPPPPPES